MLLYTRNFNNHLFLIVMNLVIGKYISLQFQWRKNVFFMYAYSLTPFSGQDYNTPR